MEDYIGNGRNVHHRQHHRHENHSHHHLYNHNQSSQWSLSHDPNTTTNNTHFASFDPPPSSSLSFALNNHHHTHHNDSFVADSSFITMDTKPSQPLYFPATDIFPSSHQSSESLSLKLGKRLYDEGSNSVGSEIKPFTVEVPNVQDFSLVKRGKELFVPGYYQQPPLLMSSPSAVAGSPVPRCQVEGCNVGLMEAKEYHRRHKVCEMHSKAPKVIVQGLEQRFCQQCSRFHVISEFDDSKRSCRRRLAGHNERRRKNSSDSAAKNHLQGGRFQLANSTSTPAGCALSLLSSEISPTWASSPDLSSRSRAALRELIADNRAAALAKRLVLPDADSVLLVSSPNAHVPYLHQQQFLLAQALQACSRPGSSSLHAFEHMPAETLDLMRGTHAHLGPAAHLLSARSGGHTSAGTNGEDEECEI